MTKTTKRILLAVLALMLTLLTACGGQKPAETADLTALYARLGEELELPEMIQLADKRLQSATGLDPAACPQLIAAICGEGMRVDEIWLVEAADEDAAQAVQELAQARVTQVCAETENYLPDQYAVASQARIVCIGRYVALFISPDASAMEDLFRAAF